MDWRWAERALLREGDLERFARSATTEALKDYCRAMRVTTWSRDDEVLDELERRGEGRFVRGWLHRAWDMTLSRLAGRRVCGRSSARGLCPYPMEQDAEFLAAFGLAAAPTKPEDLAA